MTQTIDTSAPDVVRFLEVFDDQMLAGDVGPRFTCGEVEALAGILRAAGAEGAAAAWIEGHSWGDDDIDDLHRRPEAQANPHYPPLCSERQWGYTF